MKNIVKIIYGIFSLVFLFYLFIPNPEFPSPPPDSLQSQEPGDTETLLRRAYFTNYTREEVVEHYRNQFKRKFLFGINIPNYRLNYPPEEAQTLIRDQTRSSFLEEIVHPFRESLFINGFKAEKPKDTILIEGKVWNLKITVKYNQSNIWLRMIVGILIILLFYILFFQWKTALKDLYKVIKR